MRLGPSFGSSLGWQDTQRVGQLRLRLPYIALLSCLLDAKTGWPRLESAGIYLRVRKHYKLCSLVTDTSSSFPISSGIRAIEVPWCIAGAKPSSHLCTYETVVNPTLKA